MIAPPRHHLQVVRYAEGFGFSARQWQDAIGAASWHAGDPPPHAQPLKHGRSGSVWRARLAVAARELDCVVKVEPLGTWTRRLKAALGWTKAHRQWRGASLLARAGVDAAAPLAILRNSEAEVLILPWAEGPTLLELMADMAVDAGAGRGRAGGGEAGGGEAAAGYGGVALERAVCEQLAAMIASMEAGKVFNRDGKPSNVVLDDSARHGIRVVDTVGVFRAPDAFILTLEIPEVLRDLYLEPAGCGFPPRRTLAMRLLRAIASRLPDATREDAKATWREVARMVEEHGDPRPIDDPFTQPALPRRS